MSLRDKYEIASELVNLHERVSKLEDRRQLLERVLDAARPVYGGRGSVVQHMALRDAIEHYDRWEKANGR